MSLPIITFPNSVLTKKAEEIKNVRDPEIRQLILDMLETMKKSGNALGLAAPQVGKSLRLCIIQLEGKTYILINPVFKSKSFRKVVFEEGCLSFPNEYYPIKRHKKVKVEAMDRNGKIISINADGLLSRALQHEIDHLDGVLFVSRKVKNKQHQPNEQSN